jgi:hypothetical protein
MKTRTIPKENTTPGCYKSFMSKNRTMIKKEDYPRLEMLVDYLQVDGLYLSAIAMVDLFYEGGNGSLGGGGSGLPRGGNKGRSFRMWW